MTTTFLRRCRTNALVLRKHTDDAEMLDALFNLGLEKIEPRPGDAYNPFEHCPIRPGTRPVIKACTGCGWRKGDEIVLRAGVLLEADD